MNTFNLKATKGSHVDSEGGRNQFRCWFLETEYNRPGEHGPIDFLTESGKPLGLFHFALEPFLSIQCFGRLLGHTIYRGRP